MFRDPKCTGGNKASNYTGLLHATGTAMLKFLHDREDRNLKINYGATSEVKLLTRDELIKIIKDKHHQKSKALKKAMKPSKSAKKAINFDESDSSDSDESSSVFESSDADQISTSSNVLIVSSVATV